MGRTCWRRLDGKKILLKKIPQCSQYQDGLATTFCLNPPTWIGGRVWMSSLARRRSMLIICLMFWIRSAECQKGQSMPRCGCLFQAYTRSKVLVMYLLGEWSRAL